MILFFFGDDSYRIHQQLKKLKEKFISASLGDTNLAIIDCKTADYNSIVRQILAMPFLSKTRLVTAENILSEGSKELQEKLGDFLRKVPSSTILVFTETKLDKRLSLFKKLLKSDKTQEFKLLDDLSLRRWIKKEIEDRGGSIPSEQIDKLVEYIGPDLWRMTNEIDKLIAYNKQISTESIELLIKSKIESDIFILIDAIARKNTKIALKEYQNLTNSGVNELYILSMIAYQYRNLLILKDAQIREKTNSPWVLAKKTGVNPYTAQKMTPLLSHFEMEELKENYRKILDFDIALKTGKIENRAGLTLLIVKLIKEVPLILGK